MVIFLGNRLMLADVQIQDCLLSGSGVFLARMLPCGIAILSNILAEIQDSGVGAK